MLTSCIEKPPTEPNDNEMVDEVLKKETLVKRYIDIGNYADSVVFIDEKEKGDDKQLECGYYYVEGWVFDHFEEMPGKALGIWPHSVRYTDINRLIELRENWCFSYYCHPDGYNNNSFNMAMQAGFTADKTLIQIRLSNYLERIQYFSSISSSIYGYYIDEPLKNGYPIESFAWVKGTLIELGISSLFLTGSYRTTYCLDAYVDYTNHVMFSGYSNFWNYAGCNVTGLGADQRSEWNDMQNRYGSSKFNQTWINQYLDRDEFINLFDRAKNLGLSIVWNFATEDANDLSGTHLWNLCSAAWYKGYLRRFSHKVKYEYKCYNETTPCDCPPINIDPDSWYLNKVIHYYSTISEDIPND